MLDVKAVVLRSMLGLPFTSALRFPTYFGYATDKRVLPRVAFSNHIVGKGPIDVDPAWEALAWPPPATDAAVARLTGERKGGHVDIEAAIGLVVQSSITAGLSLLGSAAPGHRRCCGQAHRRGGEVDGVW